MSPSRLPLVLYAANGIMPVTLCLRDGLWWAAILGAAAMALPVALAWRPAARTERSSAMTPTHGLTTFGRG